MAETEEEVAENWGAGAWGREGWYQVQPPEDGGVEGAPGASFPEWYLVRAPLLGTPGPRHPSLRLHPAFGLHRERAAWEADWEHVKCDGACAG